MGHHISYHADTRARAIAEGNGLFTLSVDDRLVKGKIGAITMQGQARIEVLRDIIILMNKIKHGPQATEERVDGMGINTELLEAFKAFVKRAGPQHDDGCPGDDTCSCSSKALHDRVNAAIANADRGTSAILDFNTLRAANVSRCAKWHNGEEVSLEFRMVELAGEAGEACNAAKKIARLRLGIKGGFDARENLAEELADTVICCDLAAEAAGIDLGKAVANKFNATSEKHGFPERIGGGA